LEYKDPAQRWARWITLLSVFLGLVVMAISKLVNRLNRMKLTFSLLGWL
jgi:hypothetical protein